MHENGPYTVNEGSMIHINGYNLIDYPSILIDTDTGTVLKSGRYDVVYPAYQRVCTAYQKLPELLSSIKLITFNAKYPEFDYSPEGHNFDIDEICTIMNYMNNCIGEDKMNELFTMSLQDLQEKIKTLQSIGF